MSACKLSKLIARVFFSSWWGVLFWPIFTAAEIYHGEIWLSIFGTIMSGVSIIATVAEKETK